MILKKPYGFLIKNFRLIHIILTIITIYIAISTKNILDFFITFVNNGYTVTVIDNMASTYITWLTYLSTLLAIIILLAVFILLRVKKKPNKMYLCAIIYYIILFVFVFISAYLINDLSNGLWSTAEARTYRDIARILYYPQLIFVIIIGIRALGFNVKQFDFKNDLKELEITDADSEEIELNINFKTYKAERIIRRFIREFYYYYLENKKIFYVVGSILIVVTIFLMFKSYEKLKYTYDENESFTYNNFRINVLDSMITNVSLSGNKIYQDDYYLVLKLEITNNSNNNQKLDYNNLKIYVGNEYIYPSLDIGNYFIDYGDPFMNDVFFPSETVTYIIPYMLDQNQVKNNYRLTLYTGSSTKSENFLAKTINVKLKPDKYYDVELVRNAKINENVSFSSTFLGNTTLNIQNSMFDSRYEYQYEKCYREDCHTYTDLIVVDSLNALKQTLVILDYDFTIDSETEAYKNIKNINTFINSFASIEYVIDEQTYTATVKNVTTSNLNDKIVLQTTNNILNADEVNLLITIRNRCYKIKIV